MSELLNILNASSSDKGWNSYWNSTEQGSALSSEGFEQLQLKKLWLKFFENQIGKYEQCKILDIACGNGVLSALADDYLKQEKLSHANLYCLDFSDCAIEVIKQRFPEATGVVADARKMPFENNKYQLVVSHFGIEYADLSAFDEVARVLAPTGEAMMICHYQGSAIYLQCQKHLKIIDLFIHTDMLNIAKNAFIKAFSAIVKQTKIKQTKNQQIVFSDKALLEVSQKVEQLLTDFSGEPITQTLRAIFSDIEYMYREIQGYHPQDVLDWFNKTIPEILAYRKRMQSMLDAALDEAAIKNIVDRLEALQTPCESKILMSEKDNEEIALLIRFTQPNH